MTREPAPVYDSSKYPEMPRETLQDLALAVLRYDQGVRKFRRELPSEPEDYAKPVIVNGVPDLDDLYDEMVDAARQAVQSGLLPRY